MTQASDDIIWTLINNGFCSFKSKTITQNFCRNEYNVTGLCNRHSCPLGNSRYATILEKEGKLVLHIKTAERQHLPSQLWETKELSSNVEQALVEIDYELKYWSSWLRDRVKQRFLKMTESLTRMRRLKKRTHVKLHRVDKKRERQERTREEKAENIANIEKKITQELLDRLKQGTYDDIYNFKKETWDEVLDEQELSEEEEDEEEDEFYADDYEENDFERGGDYSNEDSDNDSDDDSSGDDEYDSEQKDDSDEEDSDEGENEDEYSSEPEGRGGKGDDLEDLDQFLSGDNWDDSMFSTGGPASAKSSEPKTNTNSAKSFASNNNTKNSNNNNSDRPKALSQGARQRQRQAAEKRKNVKMPKGSKSQKKPRRHLEIESETNSPREKQKVRY